ncbi:MAG: BrnA antitoxin family protein [Bdellovibrionales bacterium]
MKKKFPDFKSNAEAEAFVNTADLSKYDFSDMTPMRFELRRKDKSISLRLPAPLLDSVRNNAERIGIPYQRFIRMAIEQAVERAR